MYKYITIARNEDKQWTTSMYIYKKGDKYYISRTYPKYAKFQGDSLDDPTEYYIIDYPQELKEDEIKNGKVKYWSLVWEFSL